MTQVCSLQNPTNSSRRDKMRCVKTSVALVGLCLLLATRAHAKPREVSFNCGDLLSGPPDKPLLALDALMNQHPSCRIFHLIWSASGTLGGDNYWVFYDRQTQTLRLKDRGEYFSGNDEDDEAHHTRQRTAYSKAYRFSGVSRSRLHRLMRFYRDKPNEDGSNLAFLTQLPKFGCSMVVTQNTTRTYYPKN